MDVLNGYSAPVQLANAFIEKYRPKKTWLAAQCGLASTLPLYAFLDPPKFPKRSLHAAHFAGIAAFLSREFSVSLTADDVARDFESRGGKISVQREPRES